MRYHRLDLQADLGTDRLPYRRLGVLLAHLPRESAYVQAVAGPVALWGQTEHLLATIVDTIVQLNHNYVQAHSKKTLKPLKLMRRPGVTPAEDDDKRQFKSAPMSIVEFERWRAARRRRGGGSKVKAVGGDD